LYILAVWFNALTAPPLVREDQMTGRQVLG
jgi:hypothetical protein